MIFTVEEVSIGLITLVGRVRHGGAHVDVQVRGSGMAGQRPLCGSLVLSRDEWRSLSEARARSMSIKTEVA